MRNAMLKFVCGGQSQLEDFFNLPSTSSIIAFFCGACNKLLLRWTPNSISDADGRAFLGQILALNGKWPGLPRYTDGRSNVYEESPFVCRFSGRAYWANSCALAFQKEEFEVHLWLHDLVGVCFWSPPWLLILRREFWFVSKW